MQDPNTANQGDLILNLIKIEHGY